jgi:hypothetical protein
LDEASRIACCCCASQASIAAAAALSVPAFTHRRAAGSFRSSITP